MRSPMMLIDGASFYLYSSSNTYRGTFRTNSSGEVVFDSPGAFRFTVADSEKVTILSTGKVGIGTSNPSEQLHLYQSASSTSLVSYIQNTSNTASSYAYQTISVGGTSAADPFVRFTVTGGSSWSMGIVNAESDRFDISAGTFLGTNDFFTILTQGSVGIGTTSPSGRFHLLSPASTTSELIIDATSTTSRSQVEYRNAGGIKWTSASGTTSESFRYKLTDGASGNEVLTVLQTSGFVGVGTTNPGSLFTAYRSSTAVTDQIRIEQASTGDATLSFLLTGGQAFMLGIDNSDSDKFKLGSSNSDLGSGNFVTIDTSGNVGIGTTGPGMPLHILSSEANIFRVQNSGADSNPNIGIQNDVQTYILQTVGARSDNFEIYDSTNTATRLAITTTGNVGIGTTSPGAQLAVSLSGNQAVGTVGGGSIFTTVATGATTIGNRSAAGLTIQQVNGTNNNYADIVFRGGGSATDVGYFGMKITSHAGNTGDFYWSTGTSERMRITSDGNVGIGTTSPESLIHLVQSSAGGRGATLAIDNPATSTLLNESQIAFLTDAGASVAGSANARIRVVNRDAGNGAVSLSIVTWDGAAEASRIYINESGLIGIATTVPSTLLHLGLSGTTLGTLGFAGNTSGLITMNSAAAAGTWTFTLPTSGGTNTYALTTNGSGVSSWSQINLTSAVTGTLPVANGGTGATTLTGMLKGNGTSAFTAITGTANYVTFWSDTNTISSDANFTWDASLLTVVKTAIGTTQSDTYGVALQNTTAAAAGAQQYSPPYRVEGQGWKTDATAASQSVEFRWYARPVQGAAAPTGLLTFESSIAGGSYAGQITMSSAGGLSVGSTEEMPSGVINAVTGFRVVGAATSGNYLRGNGTNFVSAALAAGDMTGTLAVANGGTGATTLTGMLKGNGTSAITAVTGATNRVTFWSDANTLSSNAGFTYDGTTLTLDADITLTGAQTIQTSTGQLDIKTAGAGAIVATPFAGSNFSVVLSGAGDFIVNTNQLYVDTSTGNVGIGDTTPDGKLHINDGTNRNIRIWSDAASEGTTGMNIQSFNDAVNSNMPLTLSGSLISLMQGNVGIGTTSPFNPLFVVGTIKSATSNTTGMFALGANSQEPAHVGIYRGAAGSLSGGNFLNVGGYGGIVFTSSASELGSQSEVMRITDSGNVGIATTNPSSFKLQVAGNIGFDSDRTYNFGSTALRAKDIWSSPGTVQQQLAARPYHRGLRFDTANNARIVTGDISAQNIGTSDFSIWLRVKIPSSNPAAVQGIIGLSSSNTNNIAASGFIGYLDTDGTLHFRTYHSSGTSNYREVYTTTSVVTNYGGRVVDIHFVRNATTPSATVYVNAISEALTAATSGTDPTWANSITSTYCMVGAYSTTVTYDNVIYRSAVFNNALSTTDVDEIVNDGIPYRYQWGSQTELVANGSFASDTSWTKDTGWTITGGVARASSAANNTKIYQTPATALVAGKKYRTVFTVSGYSAGGVYVHLAQATNGTTRSANGTFTEELTLTSFTTSEIALRASGTTTLDCDDFSVKRLGAFVDFDLENADPTASLTVADRANSLDGTLSSASLVTQMAQIKHFNILKDANSVSLTTTGNAGIGTTNPSGTLHIYGSGAQATIQTSSSSNPGLNLQNSSATTLARLWVDISNTRTYWDNGTNAQGIAIDSSGNVSIGTQSPSSLFTVYRSSTAVTDQVRIEQASTGDSTLSFLLTGGQAFMLGIDNSDSDKFKIGTSNSDLATGNLLTIDTSGNVGIGTTGPGFLTHIYKNTDAGISCRIDNPNTGSSALASLSLVSSSVISTLSAYSSGGYGYHGTISDHIFYGVVNNTLNTDTYITSTTNYLRVNLVTSRHSYLACNAATGQETGLQFQTSGTTNWWIYRPASTTELRFHDGTADRMLFASGNVGIGAYPAASRKLHVGGECRFDVTTSLGGTIGDKSFQGWARFDINGTNYFVPLYN